MTKRFVWAALVCGFAAVAACSSSNNGSGGGGSGGSCAESLTGTAGSACGACEQSKCSSQMSGIESGCSDLLSCVCPSGTYNASLVEQCASKAEESSCTSASQAMSACVSANCSSECEGTSSSSGGSSSGGSSSGGSSSGGSSSGSSGTTDVAFCSVTSQNTCYVFGNNPGETVSGDDENCTAMLGGTVATSCPTAGLVGCCLYTSPNDYECFYSGTQATDCPGVNGWTTTIP